MLTEGSKFKPGELIRSVFTMASSADGDPTQQRLQEHILALEKQLQEKDDQYFELSATMATIQAETSFEIQKIQKETSLQLNLSKEELRRITLEANQAHMALSRFRKQQLQPPESRLPLSSSIVPRALSNAGAESLDAENKPPATVFVKATSHPPPVVFHTGPELARHLLKLSPEEDSIHRFLEQAQHANQLQETDLVWHILQSWSYEGIKSAKQWLEHALAWSPTSRAMLRQACCNDEGKGTRGGSRIRCPTIEVYEMRGGSRVKCPPIDLQAISSSLMNPLRRPDTIPSDAPISNPFDSRVCQEWMVKIGSEQQDWPLISILMRDCSCEEELAPWFKLVSTELPSKWEAFAQSHMAAGPRRVHSVPPSTGQLMTKDVFIQSLYLMCDTFRKPIADRAVMAIMLDLLEYEILSKACDYNVILGVLGFLSTICENDTSLLRTKMVTTQEEMAQSGLGVAILVLTVSQLQLDECIDSNATQAADSKKYEKVRNDTIRLMHQVLRGRPPSICFSSLIDERRHDYLGVCGQILVAPRVNPSIKTMVRLQMDEIQADREDEEELKFKEKQVAVTDLDRC